MVVKMVVRPIAKLSNRLTPPSDTRQAGDSSDGVIARSQIAQIPVSTAQGDPNDAPT